MPRTLDYDCQGLHEAHSTLQEYRKQGDANPELRKQLPHLLLKFLHIFELPVDGREANVGDIVNALEFPHNVLPDLGASHFAALLRPPLLLEPSEHRFDPLLAHGALRARKPDAPLELRAAIRLARPIALHNDEIAEFLPLEGREPVIALRAFAAPAHSPPIFRQTGIHDGCIVGFAARTKHLRGSSYHRPALPQNFRSVFREIDDGRRKGRREHSGIKDEVGL